MSSISCILMIFQFFQKRFFQAFFRILIRNCLLTRAFVQITVVGSEVNKVEYLPPVELNSNNYNRKSSNIVFFSKNIKSNDLITKGKKFYSNVSLNHYSKLYVNHTHSYKLPYQQNSKTTSSRALNREQLFLILVHKAFLLSSPSSLQRKYNCNC